MAKSKTMYVCQQCGAQQPKWSGQCSECGTWNSLVESVIEPEKKNSTVSRAITLRAEESIIKFGDVQQRSGDQTRISTGMREFDRVLGSSTIDGRETAGIVRGSVILLGGEPGIGKSTLLTQLVIFWLKDLKKNTPNDSDQNEHVTTVTPKVLMYVCGEESPSQIAMRIDRMMKQYTLEDAEHNDAKARSIDWKSHFLFVTSTNVDEICSIMERYQPAIAIIDSIQTLTTNDLTGVAGSVGQLRESTFRLTQLAKKQHIPTFLVGHVTKDGEIAGPKVLEHVVDTVLELSGERTGEFRILRAIKNRFGATDEVGLFAMNETGLREVSNPSELFLQYSQTGVAGSAVSGILEGTRPLLIEVQSLVIRSQLAMPRRVGQGIGLPRIQVLTAVLQKHGHIPLGECDVFVNIAGGITVKETSIDLGVCMALVSSFHNVPLPAKTVYIGEVGLLGEIRAVPFLEKRIKEATRLGFTSIYSSQTHRHLAALIKDVLKVKS